jgi:hypothetical protein
MGKGLPPKEMRLYRACDEALFCVWDPIGVSGAPEARDEYQAYLPGVFQVVKAGTRDELIGYLVTVMDERIGLTPSEELAARAADYMLRARAWIDRTSPE